MGVVVVDAAAKLAYGITQLDAHRYFPNRCIGRVARDIYKGGPFLNRGHKMLSRPHEPSFVFRFPTSFRDFS
jgi:hypothetical protein